MQPAIRHRLAYFANQFPLGVSETFIWPEVGAHMEAGHEIVFCPIRAGAPFHSERSNINGILLDEPLFSISVFSGALLAFLRKPSIGFRALVMALRGHPRVVARNLAVLPKALWLADKLSQIGVDHVHAHWLSTPATAAMVAAAYCDVPYSITAHRIDISQRNLLPEKLRSASFVRAIDHKGRDEIRACDPLYASKVTTVYLGTDVPLEPAPLRESVLDEIRLVTAARLVEKKGHSDLIAAVSIAVRCGVLVRLDVFGEGPLEKQLLAQARELGVHEVVKFKGPLPHRQLLAILRAGDYDVAALASATAPDGDREGIPAFLMEAMAAGIPVISTDNGGITELIDPECGIIVREHDQAGLAKAIVLLARDPLLRMELANAGRKRVKAEFNVAVSAARLRAMMMLPFVPEAA
jgi:colanic acid/amylovoran biosynthesis glycosyltransferase